MNTSLRAVSLLILIVATVLWPNKAVQAAPPDPFSEPCFSDAYYISPGLLDKAFNKITDDFIKEVIAKEAFATLYQDFTGSAAGLSSAMKEFDETLKNMKHVYSATKMLEMFVAEDYEAAKKFANKLGKKAAFKTALTTTMQRVGPAVGDMFFSDALAAGLSSPTVVGALMTAYDIIKISEKELKTQQCLLEIDLLTYTLLEDPELGENIPNKRRVDRLLHGYLHGAGPAITNKTSREDHRSQFQCYLDLEVPAAQRETCRVKSEGWPRPKVVDYYYQCVDAMSPIQNIKNPKSNTPRKRAAMTYLRDLDLARARLVSKQVTESTSMKTLSYLNSAIKSQPNLFGLFCEQFKVYEYDFLKDKYLTLRGQLPIYQQIDEMDKQIEAISQKTGANDPQYKQLIRQRNDLWDKFTKEMTNKISQDRQLGWRGIKNFSQLDNYGERNLENYKKSNRTIDASIKR